MQIYEEGNDRTMTKLKDKAGASITYALLLFLVCGIVGSIVLAAGTAAAGRISQSVASDQRYYSVTSAARLLKDGLDGISNTIIFTGIETDTDDNPENGELDSSEIELENTVFVLYSQEEESQEEDSLTELTYAELLTAQLDPLSYGSAVLAGLKDEPEDAVELTLTTEDPEKESLKVTVSQTIDTSADPPVIKLDVSNSDTDNGTYTLRLTFTADVTDRTGKKKSKDASGNETVTLTQTKKITWNYYGIETLTASDAQEETEV